jgi:hypothetical protein
MMVCMTCKGLQKHLKAVDGVQETETGALKLLDASLPELRASAANCRACALLLQGILLHHDRFRDVKENDIYITAESFISTTGRSSQDHLSVEARWQDPHDDDVQEEDEHGHGWPNLKLEFFTDGGRFTLQPTALSRARWIIADMSDGAPIIRTSGLVRIRVADGLQMVSHHFRRLGEDVRSRVSLCKMQALQRYGIC